MIKHARLVGFLQYGRCMYRSYATGGVPRGTKEPNSQGVSSSHKHELHSHSHGLLDHGHGHSHTHSLTGELLSTGQLNNPAVRITLIGFVANVGMAVAKGIGGMVFHSQSLIADAIHALSDLVSDVMTLFTVSVAKKPPSATFPNGYGRIEALGALGVSSSLLFAGLSMGWSSLSEIFAALDLDIGQTIGISHVHAHSHRLPAKWNAAGVALVSIFIKEALFQATRKVAEKENSPVLLANAWHHRVDSLVSAVAVISISLGQVFQMAWIDPVGGLLVSGIIVKAGWRPAVDATLELCGSVKPVIDSSKWEEFTSRARNELHTLAPNYKIVRCTLEPYGPTYVGSVQLANIDGKAEQVAAELKKDLMKIEHMRQVYIRI